MQHQWLSYVIKCDLEISTSICNCIYSTVKKEDYILCYSVRILNVNKSLEMLIAFLIDNQKIDRLSNYFEAMISGYGPNNTVVIVKDEKGRKYDIEQGLAYELEKAISSRFLESSKIHRFTTELIFQKSFELSLVAMRALLELTGHEFFTKLMLSLEPPYFLTEYEEILRFNEKEIKETTSTLFSTNSELHEFEDNWRTLCVKYIESEINTVEHEVDDTYLKYYHFIIGLIANLFGLEVSLRGLLFFMLKNAIFSLLRVDEKSYQIERIFMHKKSLIDFAVKLEKIDKREIPAESNEIRLFVIARNETLRLPYFLKYY